jgi:hypothetical protein
MKRSRNCFWLGEHAVDLLRDLRANSYREPNGGAQRCRRANAGTAATHAGLRAQQGAKDSKAVLSRHSTLQQPRMLVLLHARAAAPAAIAVQDCPAGPPPGGAASDTARWHALQQYSSLWWCSSMLRCASLVWLLSGWASGPAVVPSWSLVTYQW